MPERHGAAGVLSAVESAAENLFSARKSWAGYLENPGGEVPAGAEKVAAEIDRLYKRASALHEQLTELFPRR
jgi:hypothetical protein